MTTQCCANCLNWMRKPSDVGIPPDAAPTTPAVDPRIPGYCRAHPPVRLSSEERAQLGMTKAAASFPTVNDDQWCREWASNDGAETLRLPPGFVGKNPFGTYSDKVEDPKLDVKPAKGKESKAPAS